MVGDEMDFRSFLGSVEYLRPNVTDGVKEGLTCRFVDCGEGPSLATRDDGGVNGHLACCSAGSESPSVTKGDEAANGLKEACCCVGFRGREDLSLTSRDECNMKEGLA